MPYTSLCLCSLNPYQTPLSWCAFALGYDTMHKQGDRCLFLCAGGVSFSYLSPFLLRYILSCLQSSFSIKKRPTGTAQNRYFCDADILPAAIFCRNRYFCNADIFSSRRKNIVIAKISVSTKYRRRQNIGEENLLTSQKYWFRQNIAAGKISAKKKYLHRKNIGFDKISLPAKYRRRKNIVIAKISVSTKYGRRQNISEEKISALQK